MFLCFTNCLCGCVFFSDILSICSAVAPDRQPRHHPTTQFFTGRMPFPTPKHWRQKERTVTSDKDSAVQTICRISTIVVGNCVQVLHRFHASIRWHVGSLAADVLCHEHRVKLARWRVACHSTEEPSGAAAGHGRLVWLVVTHSSNYHVGSSMIQEHHILSNRSHYFTCICLSAQK